MAAHLRGGAAGDSDGTGRANFTFYRSQGRVCATVTWSRIDKPLAAHIHRGGPGVNGPIVIDLSGSVTGGSKCATGVSKGLISQILAQPGRYYFNVHNAKYPNGAIRGQLHRVTTMR